MPDFQFITCEEAQGVAWISINRPPLNIIDIATARELSDAVAWVKEQEEALSALVFTSEGNRAFSAGVDVADHTEDKAEAMLDGVHSIFRALDRLSLPTVAALKGLALGGGCKLALCCDLVVAADNLKIGLPEIKVGVYPPLAAGILATLIPPKRAFEMLLGGDALAAAEAQALGLVNLVVPLTSFAEELGKFLGTFTMSSRAVLRSTKKAMRSARGRPFPEALTRVERLYLDELMLTEDAQEGLAAFLEKRRAAWRNR